MKKRIFSTLLMGAFFIASMSMFTSCKDYDDDINNNADAIAKLQAQVATLETALNNAKAEATTAHATFATKTELNSAVTALETEIRALVTAQQLQEAIDAAKATLQAAIDGKADKADLTALATKVDGIDSNLNTLGTTLSEVKAASDAATQNIAAQQQAIEALQTKIGELETTLASKASQAEVDELKQKLQTLSTEFAEAQTKISTNTSDIATLKSDMQAANQKINKVAADLNLLTVFVNRMLTSLVFQPNVYIEGIEAIELNAVTSNFYEAVDASKLNTADEEFTYVLDEKNNPVQVAYFPNVTARYHFNPSSADLTGYEASFYSRLVETREDWGIIEPINPKVSNANKIESGVLGIGIQNDPVLWNALYGNIPGLELTSAGDPYEYYFWNYDLYGEEWVAKLSYFTQFALQLHKGDAKADTATTSDYAMIMPVWVRNLRLSDNEVLNFGACNFYGAPTHLTQAIKGAEGAIALNVETQAHKIAYTDKNVDLKDFIEVHYDSRDYITDQSWSESHNNVVDRLMSEELFDSLGLKYEFYSIEWTDGDHKTSEDKFVTVTTDGIATPKLWDNGKKVDATRASIGRTPIVRVELKDAEGNLLTYGYIKLIISGEEKAAKYGKITLDGTLYVNCDEEDDATLKTTWEDIQNQILNQLNISKENFDAAYEFDYTNWYFLIGGKNLTTAQYNNVCEDGDEATQFGIIDWEEDGEPGSLTHILTWTMNSGAFNILNGELNLVDPQTGAVTPIEAGKFFDEKTGASTKAVKAMVKFTSKSDNDPDIYVVLTIPAGAIKAAAAQVGIKTDSEWHAKYDTAGDAKEELRAHVPLMRQVTGNTALTATDFKYDISAAYKDKKFQAVWADKKFAGYDSWKTYLNDATLKFVPREDAKNYKAIADQKLEVAGKNDPVEYENAWIVNGYTGKKYLLQVNAAENAIIAVAEANVKGKWSALAAVENIVVMNGYVAEYQAGVVAQDILNYKPASALAFDQTFTANVQVVSGAWTCYQPLTTQDVIIIGFLRPVTLNAGDPDAVKNMTQGGTEVDLSNNWGLEDWNKKWNNGAATQGDNDAQKAAKEYETYYGIQEIQYFFNKTDIRTDYDAPKAAINGNSLAEIEKLPTYDKSAAATGNDSWYLENWGTNTTGKVRYQGTQQVNSKEFHIYVPIKMTYTFGSQYVYGVITVTKD